MTGTDPTRLFEAGLLALGFQVRAQREPRQLEMAARVLAMATQGDPLFADAWLGRLAAGDRSMQVYEGLWRARARLGVALSGYGIHPSDLGVRFESNMLINAPLANADVATAAYVVMLTGAGRFDEAAAVVDGERRDAESAGRKCPMTLYSGACLYFGTARWPQVIELASSLRGDIADPIITAAARALIVGASTHLGLYSAALDLVSDPIPGGGGHRLVEVLPEAAATISYYAAMCHRALGNEMHAAEALRAVLAVQSDYPGARQMLDNPSLVLATTDQFRIDARTDPWDPATEAAADEAAAADQLARRAEDLAAALKDLDDHVGLASVKRAVARLRASVEINELRIAQGLPPTSRSRHLVLTGPPGTGKTTVARVIARIYCSLGILAKDTVLEVGKADLVGGYLGQTEEKTNAVIDKALDGVLFVDEAYTLVNTGSSNDFGLVALDTLLARMENDRDRLVVIVAGYRDEMTRFMSANEGLRSRFPKTIEFPSYSADELVQIAVAIADRTEHVLTDQAQAVLGSVCTYLGQNTAMPPSKEYDVAGRVAVARPMVDLAGNGRLMRNVVEFSVEEQEFRAHAERAAGRVPDLRVLTAADVLGGVRTVLESDSDGLFAGLDALLDEAEQGIAS